MAADEIVILITNLAVAMTGFIHTLTLVVGVLGLTIWGLAKIARPIAPDLAGSTGGYISSLVFDGLVVMAGSTVLRVVAEVLSV